MIHPSKIPLWLRGLLALIVVAALDVARLRLSWNAVIPFGFTIPLALIAWFRSRGILWAAVIALVAAIVIKQMAPHEDISAGAGGFYARGSWGGTIVTIVNLMVLAGLGHLWITSLNRIEAQHSELAAANFELGERDKRILRTNEELRKQAMELERQGIETENLLIEVAHERTRYETVLRTMPFAVAVADAPCADLRLNPAGGLLFGATADVNVMPQLPNWVLFHNGRSLPAEQFPVLRTCRDGVEIVAEELELLTPGGKRITLLANARAIRDQGGKLMGAVAAFVDITPQKELQRELDLRRREAEEASVRKTRFLAAVSHDIRTPANAISLLAELIRRTSANPAMAAEIPEMASELQASAVSLINLVSDVLDVARFDSGKVEIQESQFVLAKLLDDEHRQLLPLAREKGLDFRWEAPAEAVHLRTDRIKLARILGNLIGNAIKFTETGTVRVQADVPDGRGIRIIVSDSGIGIPPEFQRHIFDEFFQMRNPERDRNKGTGLGLTICKRLVDAMGGSLEVTSTPGEGSTFTVTLPGECVMGYGDGSPSAISRPSG